MADRLSPASRVKTIAAVSLGLASGSARLARRSRRYRGRWKLTATGEQAGYELVTTQYS